MNRARFLTALLGLVGVKVAAQEVSQEPYKKGDKITIIGAQQENLSIVETERGCFYFSDNGYVVGNRVPCKEGEEYCPIGHSQKPAIYGFSPIYAVVSIKREDKEDFQIEQRICSTCGVVYVIGRR